MRMSRMRMEPAELTRKSAAYTYRPSVLGAPWEFKLTDDGIAWVAGAKSGRVPFRNVRRLRMSYRPANMQSHRFMTELWADGAPKLRIVSSSWKSMVEQERLDKPYAAFVTELHRRIARAGAATQFERGSHRLVYWPGLILFAGVVLGLCGLIVRALQVDAVSGAAFIGVFLALFLWRGGNFLRRNWPGVYSPDALPAELMPKG
jgi:hypothetical protein